VFGIPRYLVSYTFEKGFETTYVTKKQGHGVYAFVLKGDFNIGGITVNERDGLGISNEDSFTITAESAEAEILLMRSSNETISKKVILESHKKNYYVNNKMGNRPNTSRDWF
jgi:redox-sensitive bicupin YhaK (pirin superfamily)